MNKLLEVIKTPQDSVNDNSVIIKNILFKNGDKVKSDDIIAEIETSKALLEISCQKSGYLNILCELDQEVLIGEILFEIYSDKLDKKHLKGYKKNKINKTLIKPLSKSKTKFSKDAKKLIVDNNININLFNELEFVTTNEVNRIIGNENTLTNIQSNPNNIIKPNIELVKDQVKLNKQKTNEIRYLRDVNSSGVVSRLTININSDLKSIYENQNFIKSTPLPLITYEVSRLLIKYPALNSYYYQNMQMIHKDINIGIAFDNGKNGLKVASIFNPDSKDLNSIEEEISELSIKYNNNKLSIKEISSASFTITDLFSTGVTNFHPLINNENSAILGVCGLQNNGFNIELSFDHRISNGLEASKFLNDLKERLEARYSASAEYRYLDKIKNIKCSKCYREAFEDNDGSIQFLRSINSKEDSYICSICLDGW